MHQIQTSYDKKGGPPPTILVVVLLANQVVPLLIMAYLDVIKMYYTYTPLNKASLMEALWWQYSTSRWWSI